MIAFATPEGIAATVATTQELFACATCTKDKPRVDFGTVGARGDKPRRAPECRVCARERWTRNRRDRLEARKCMVCRQSKKFTEFPITICAGKQRLGMTCVDCVTAKAMEAVLQADVPASRRVRPLRTNPDDDHTRRWASAPDFTQLAQEMLYPDRAKPRHYRKFTRQEREAIYAVSRELARRYSPMWDEKFDLDPSPLDLVLRPFAKKFLLTASIPPVLAEFIASRLCEEAAVFLKLEGVSPDAILFDDVASYPH